jgi:hypothetical protein
MLASLIATRRTTASWKRRERRRSNAARERNMLIAWIPASWSPRGGGCCFVSRSPCLPVGASAGAVDASGAGVAGVQGVKGDAAGRMLQAPSCHKTKPALSGANVRCRPHALTDTRARTTGMATAAHRRVRYPLRQEARRQSADSTRFLDPDP